MFIIVLIFPNGLTTGAIFSITKKWEKANSLPSRKSNPPTEIIREFTKDGRKEVKLKTTEQNQRRSQGLTQVPGVVWSPRAPAGSVQPPRCSLAEGTCCLFCDRQICQWHWHQNTAELSWGLPLLLQSVCSGGEYSWPLQDENQDKTTLKNVTRAPRYHLLRASVRMSI